MANSQYSKSSFPDIVGLVPAAGQADRVSPLPCSKELFPVGFRAVEDNHSVRPKVVCHYLLEKMACAGVATAYIVLRAGKWDIPNYFTDGSIVNMHLAYLMMHLPFGVPYTLDEAFPFVRDAVVAFGFPDILFGPDDAYCQLLKRQAETKADIVLGLFPAERPEIMDMVDLDEGGWVRSLSIRPPQTTFQYAWIFAVWTPVFTRYQHEFLKKRLQELDRSKKVEQEELTIGQVIQAAVRDGMRGQAVVFPGHSYLDIGTPDNLVKAVRKECRDPLNHPPQIQS